MSVEALQEYVRVSKYARFDKTKGRRETWNEQIDRVVDMHRQYYAHIPALIPYIEEVCAAMKKKQVLGSQRVLQFGGKPVLDKHLRQYNCAFSYCDRPRFFQEAMYALLCGTGVGFSVQKCHVEKLPQIFMVAQEKKTFVIPDTIEGWADSIGVLLSSYFMESSVFPEYCGYTVEFDYSQIRPEGSPISWGAKAPGPRGLQLALEKIRDVIKNALHYGFKLRPIDCYDIMMHASDAVLSGGVRRSATICLFSPDDELMMKAKTGDWFTTNPQRGRSNNSAALVRGKVTQEQFHKLFSSTREFGEPGFVWVESENVGLNPCAEISFIAFDDEGRSGWGLCNLSTINGKKIKDEQDFYKACRLASIIGTIQAGYTNFSYLGPVTESIVRRDALLGVSITGMMDNPEILFDPKIQRKGAKIVLEVNEEVAKIIGINPCKRSTCVKPEGTTSCLLGSSSGVHPHHANKYFRLLQENESSDVLKYFELHNPDAVERSVWAANGTDKVISFLCEVPRNLRTKNKFSALELLELVKSTQENWVATGTRKKGNDYPKLNHNVSNTINVKLDEWDQVEKYIFDHQEVFAGISLLPISGDKDFRQAPFTTVFTHDEIVESYGEGALFASGLIERALDCFGGDLWAACDAAIIKTHNAMSGEQISWALKLCQFAERYLGGDTKKATYLLKDVYNWKKWLDLKRVYKEVPWEDFHEEDFVLQANENAGAACSGGACTITRTL
jgi:ribonucleoside-triphosphate reductase